MVWGKEMVNVPLNNEAPCLRTGKRQSAEKLGHVRTGLGLGRLRSRRGNIAAGPGGGLGRLGIGILALA